MITYYQLLPATILTADLLLPQLVFILYLVDMPLLHCYQEEEISYNCFAITLTLTLVVELLVQRLST